MDHNKLWKILKEVGISDHQTCLLRNLSAGQETTVRNKHGIADWFQIGKGVRQGSMLSSCSCNSHAEYIMQNARLDEAQAVIKTAWRNINNLRYADDTTLTAESKEELTEPLEESERGEGESWLKSSIQKTKIIWSHHFTANRRRNNGNSDRLYFLGLQKSLQMVTVAMKLKHPCSLEEKL